MAVEIKRDQYGRPLIPDPATGKMRSWTRATTLAGTISDRFALEQWSQRNIVKGFAARQELLLRAVAAGDDRDALAKVATAALEAAKSSEASAIGTALHTITERLDSGEEVEVPDGFRADVDAYRQATGEAGLAVVPGWIERFVVVPEVDAAGTADRLFEVTSEIGLPMIGDLKTGANAIKFGMVEIAAQLAIYSRASHWWDGAKLQPMPKVDQAVGIVVHMPAREGRCDLYVVDLHRGWEIAKLCHEARKWRSAKKLATLMPTRLAPDPNDVIRERVRDIVEALEGAPLPLPWPAGVTPPKRQEGAYSAEELERIRKWCDRVAPVTTAPAH